MVINKIDNIEFRLKKLHDFSWLKRYGEAFWVVDETGSGSICIGMKDGEKRYFCKIAGVSTIEAEVDEAVAIEILKVSVKKYYDLEHPNLVKIIDAYEYDELYIVVFEWADGECLFDHWNFSRYERDSIISPKERFRQLPIDDKINLVNVLFSFLINMTEKGYAAVDFYDGSIMYNFDTKKTTICDIDLFERKPLINDKGEGWFGTMRLKAPEEYENGAVIDDKTGIFTLGALIFEFFGTFSNEEIAQRYVQKRFLPCSIEKWQLSEESYKVALKAVNLDRCNRYQTFDEFYGEWSASIRSV